MKRKLLMVVFILVLGSILTTALLAVSNITAPMIEKNTQLKITANVLKALNIPSTEEDADKVFEDQVNVMNVNGNAYYVSKDGGYAIEFKGSGLWGPIRGIIALEDDLEIIRGLTIIHQEETPGLGGRIAEQWYLDQFKDKVVKPQLVMVSPGKGRDKSNAIDSISGATLTCRSFIDILNQQLAEYLPLIGGES